MAASPQAHAAQLKTGDYLADDFARLLASTRSPYAAISRTMNLEPQSIRISSDAGSLMFTANLNWHESDILFRIHSNGSQDRGDESIDYPKPRIDSATHFWLRAPGQNTPWRGYSYVGDADKAVARIALGGTYVTAQGNIVQFGRNGFVRGLGPDTPFVLDNDHVVGNHFDWFWMGTQTDKGNATAFQRRGKHLILYKIILGGTGNPNDIGSPDFEHPIMDLEELKQP